MKSFTQQITELRERISHLEEDMSQATDQCEAHDLRLYRDELRNAIRILQYNQCTACIYRGEA